MSQTNQRNRLAQLSCVCGANAGLHNSPGGFQCDAICPNCRTYWYVYHCWNDACGHAEIDSRFDKRCQHDASYVCSECGKCRCLKDRVRRTVAEEEYEDLNSLESIAGIAFNGDVAAAEHWLEKDR